MNKVRFLDGLRGLAAFMVVVHHSVLAFYPALFLGAGTQTHLPGEIEEKISVSIFNLLYNGNFAVCLFFVLSGFVLSYSFFRHKDPRIVTESAVKRYIRLSLPVAFSVLVAFVCLHFSLFANQEVARISGSSWFSGFWNFSSDAQAALYEAFWGSFFSDTFEYNTVLWTISFELSGSFLVFAFLALFGTMSKRYWVYGVACIVFLQTYYLAFLLGMLLSDVAAQKKEFAKNRFYIFSFLLMLGLFLGSHLSGQSTEGTIYAFLHTSIFSDPSITWHVIGAFLTILALLHLPRLQKTLSSKPFLFLGRISFSMYLLHFIVLGTFTSFVFLSLQNVFSYNQSVVVSFFLSLVIILALSHWMSLWIDNASIRLSKHFSHRILGEK